MNFGKSFLQLYLKMQLKSSPVGKSDVMVPVRLKSGVLLLISLPLVSVI